MALAVGDDAPDFEVPAVHGATGEEFEARLSAYRGSRLVLVFYPADRSPVCTAQLEAYTAEIGSFDSLDAQVLAVSPQSIASHRDFAKARGGFAFPLLSDEDKAVARAYGNLGLLDLYRRCTYVIDSDQRVSWAHRSLGPGLGYRPAAELVDAVSAAG